MMGRQRRDQGLLFYEFRLEDRIPENHLLRRMNVFVTAVLADLHRKLKSHYGDIGRPSVDPELMIRMLIVGYCYGICSERRLCQEVELHLAYRWFCKLDLDCASASVSDPTTPRSAPIRGMRSDHAHGLVSAGAREVVRGASLRSCRPALSASIFR